MANTDFNYVFLVKLFPGLKNYMYCEKIKFKSILEHTSMNTYLLLNMKTK
jgi:hypothetical protein